MSVNAAEATAAGAHARPSEDADEFERELWATLDTVPDPHIPVSLVEMAMIYDVDADDGDVTVTMTFPCMGCPAYDMIKDDVRAALRTVRGVSGVDIEVTWDPVWSKDMLTDNAREELREAGISL
ncbi:metal-sulfur cluster assembly factor [Halobellus ruber]|uniref:Metal-sulfur cluster assembly factor n=1 Tax=Halobellus ruber TaxID=2761102 RepID=A0A7J9SJ07_9EURY|nr:metal-sulfur cluster assembly factor [Halobellus ruber]MBB6646363.1 metal-sulfur cluster assembly factor [Halobellus ruber]